MSNARKAVTVRIPTKRLQALMRARRARSQSDLINGLLAEEEERLRSHRALRETAGKLRPRQVDGRFL